MITSKKRRALYSKSRRRTKIFLLAHVLVGFLWLHIFNRCIPTATQDQSLPEPMNLHGREDIRKNYEHPKNSTSLVLIASPSLNLSDPLASVKKSIESIYTQTDRNRIFGIYVVFQPGVLTEEQQIKAQIELEKVEAQEAIYDQKNLYEKFEHFISMNVSPSNHFPREQQKIRIIFSDNNSTIECSRDVALHIQAAAQENGGVPVVEESIVVFLKPSVQLKSSNWLDQVSSHLQRHNSNNDSIDLPRNDIGNPWADDDNLPNAVTVSPNASNMPSQLEKKTITNLGALNLTPLMRNNHDHEDESMTALTLSALLRVPTHSLSEINKEIINGTEMIDLKFLDLAKGFKRHPHMAALDENGKPGYIHDAEALRKHPPQFTFDEQKGRCDHNDATMQILSQRVFVDMTGHERAERLAREGIKPRPKIFCHVYTTKQNHKRIQAIRETWGQKCDGFMAASTVTDPALNTVNIPHKGPEKYGNMWQKARSMWSYVYDNYYEDYDWFHIGGDDMYVLVENLRLYLESEEVVLASNGGVFLPTGVPSKQQPLYVGCRFWQHGMKDRVFVTGGGGYTLNKAALKALVASFPTCMPNNEMAEEDANVAVCLKKKGIRPIESKDENGADRYMHMDPEFHFNFDPKKNPRFWYAYFSMNQNAGPYHVAEKSVSFHYIKGESMMHRVHSILYGHCARSNAILSPPVPTAGFKDGLIVPKIAPKRIRLPTTMHHGKIEPKKNKNATGRTLKKILNKMKNQKTMMREKRGGMHGLKR